MARVSGNAERSTVSRPLNHFVYASFCARYMSIIRRDLQEEFPDLNNGTGACWTSFLAEAMHAPKRERTALWLTARRLDTIERSPLAMRHDVICYFSDVKSPLVPRSLRSSFISFAELRFSHVGGDSCTKQLNDAILLQCFLLFVCSSNRCNSFLFCFFFF